MTAFLLGSIGLLLASFTTSCCFEEEDVGESISEVVFGQKGSRRRLCIEKKEVDYLAQYFCMTITENASKDYDSARKSFHDASKSQVVERSTRGSKSQRVVHQLFLGDLYR